MKIFRSILALTIMLASMAASASDIQTLSGPVAVSCSGPEGKFQILVQKAQMKYSIQTTQLQTSGVVSAGEDAASLTLVSAVTFATYARPARQLLHLAASIAQKVWVPAHTECLPTRVIDRCWPVQVDGEFSNSWQEWIDLSLDVTDAHDIPANSLDFHLAIFQGQVSLGEGASCQVQGL